MESFSFCDKGYDRKQNQRHREKVDTEEERFAVVEGNRTIRLSVYRHNK